MLTKEQLQLLQSFVQICKSKPSFLHHPELGFYRDWLLSLGATLPDKSPEDEKPPTSPPPSAAKPKPRTPTPEPAEPEEPESDIELDMEGVIEAESDEPPVMPDAEKEVSEEMETQSNDKRSEAMAAFSDGNYEEAVKLFTEALEINPHSAILYAKRASTLLKLNRPKAALRDCDKAISLNPDSAGPYKFRGRAHRLLGKFEEAHIDLSMACKLDYDDQANEWLKEVEPNAKKILEHKRKQARKAEDKLIREKKERVRKAKEAYEKQKKEDEERMKAGFGEDDDDFPGGFPGGMPGGFPGGMPGGFPGGMPGGFPGGMPGGMPGAGAGGMPGGGAGGMPDLSSLFSDPEIMNMMKDPEVQAAFADVSKNPANAMKYMSDPKMKKVFDKLGSKLGGGGAAFPGAGSPPPPGGPTGGGSGGPPPTAPDVDVD